MRTRVLPVGFVVSLRVCVSMCVTLLFGIDEMRYF